MKKIMFNDRYGLTRAVLEGRKTMTRRIAYTGEVVKPNSGYLTESNERGTCVLCDGDLIIAKSFYKVGEVVAVAQNYEDVGNVKYFPGEGKWHCEKEAGWKNKMFVKACLMPHQIRITNIYVERLQNISDEDCLREGIWKDNEGGRVIGFPIGIPFYYTFDGAVRDGKQLHWTKPKEAFAALIDKVSGKGTWASKPWVFMYEFELVK